MHFNSHYRKLKRQHSSAELNPDEAFQELINKAPKVRYSCQCTAISPVTNTILTVVLFFSQETESCFCVDESYVENLKARFKREKEGESVIGDVLEQAKDKDGDDAEATESTSAPEKDGEADKTE